MRTELERCCWYTVTSLACILLATAEAAAADLVIVQDGQPKATIVIAKEAPDPVRQKLQTAADELQTYLQKISGAKLPIVDDAQNPAGALILVGRSRLTDALGIAIPAGLTPARREEGFVIACRGDRLLLAGNNDGPYHGTEYAVYDFLRSLGVRWFMPGEFGEVVPQQKTIRVPEQQVGPEAGFPDAELVAARQARTGRPGGSLEAAEQDEPGTDVRHLRRQQRAAGRGPGVAGARRSPNCSP